MNTTLYIAKNAAIKALEEDIPRIIVDVNFKNVDTLSIPVLALVAAFVIGLVVSPMLQAWWRKQ